MQSTDNVNEVVNETPNDSQDKTAEESDLFFDVPTQIKGLDGTVIHIPKHLSWGKQKIILKSFSSMIKKSAFDVRTFSDPSSVAKFIFSLFGENSDSLTTVVASIIGQSEKWIDDNLVFQEVVTIAFPFCLAFMNDVMKAMNLSMSQVKSFTGAKSSKRKNS